MKDFELYFMLFITYSFIGWIIEVMNELIINKKIVNRGFLIGPYCPIYGCGSIFMILFIKNTGDIIGTFLKIVFICAVLEYTSSYIMEKLFKTRWWDYSKNKYNINGRICLETMFLFGIGGCILLYLVNPFIISIYQMIPNLLMTIITFTLFIIFVSDMIVSFNIINGLKNTLINPKGDSTERIGKLRKKYKKSYLRERVIKAFPNIQKLKKK